MESGDWLRQSQRWVQALLRLVGVVSREWQHHRADVHACRPYRIHPDATRRAGKDRILALKQTGVSQATVSLMQKLLLPKSICKCLPFTFSFFICYCLANVHHEILKETKN